MREMGLASLPGLFFAALAGFADPLQIPLREFLQEAAGLAFRDLAIASALLGIAEDALLETK